MDVLGGWGVSQVNAALSAIGGIAAILSQIAVEWVTKLCILIWESLNGGSQMGAQGHSLQFARDRLQLCTFVALLGPFSRGTFVTKWR